MVKWLSGFVQVGVSVKVDYVGYFDDFVEAASMSSLSKTT